MQINDKLELATIYFINGEPPKGHPATSIKDGPAGYHLCYIIHREDSCSILTTSTAEGWTVPKDCWELEKRTNIPLTVSLENFLRRMSSVVATRRRYNLPFDLDLVNEVVELLGGKPVKRLEREETPVKERKEKAAPKKDKPSREGLRSIKDVEEATGLKGRIIRGILRESGLKPSEAGWVGDEAWFESIVKVVKEAQAKA